MDNNITEWLTPSQAANRLGVSPQTIREYVRRGKLRAVMTQHGRLIDPESVDRLAAERLKSKKDNYDEKNYSTN